MFLSFYIYFRMNKININNNNLLYPLYYTFIIGIIYFCIYNCLTKIKYFDYFNRFKYDKKLYIIKNIVKSIILFYLSITTIQIIPSIIHNCNYNNDLIKKYASLYVGNDIIALLFVPNLPLTTKLHHSVTTILLFYSLNIDYNNSLNIGRLLLIYSIMSCYSFLVNLYLGLRFFINKNNILDKIINTIRIMSYYIYIICCGINWSIQLYLIGKTIFNQLFNYSYLIYCLLLTIVINDDIVLIKWLKNKILFI